MGFQEPSSSLRTPSPPSLFQLPLNPCLMHCHSSKNHCRTLYMSCHQPLILEIWPCHTVWLSKGEYIWFTVCLLSCFSNKLFTEPPIYIVCRHSMRRPVARTLGLSIKQLGNNAIYMFATKFLFSATSFTCHSACIWSISVPIPTVLLCLHVNISPIDMMTDRLNRFVCF